MTRSVFRIAAWGAALAAASAALARVGGGGGYSGGGSSGGGGGDFGIVFGLIRLLVWLVIVHPVVGIPLLIVVIVIVSRSARSGKFHFAIDERPRVVGQAVPSSAGPANLTPVRSTDPFFSEPVFLDFAQLVYARAQEMRGTGRREPLEPWMASAAIDTLFSDRDGLESVTDVIVGSIRIVSASTQGGFVQLDVRFDANLTETRRQAKAQVLAGERWTFRRQAGVRSPAPERMRALGCAGCGSTLEPKSDGTCPNCGAPRTGGRGQWEVAAIASAVRRPLDPPELDVVDGDVESGTDLPTVFDPRLSANRRTFEGKHPNETWATFEERVRVAFLALQEAWSTRQWEKARPFETDALFQAHRFWMEQYAAFSLVNHVEQAIVSQIVLAKVDADAFYEAATVRIYAAAVDWTEDASGKVVGGDKNRVRAFSEYWTFLRAIPGSAAAPTNCPTCAAPLPAGAGPGTVCAYCGSKLEGGAVDWVASRIEQDDAYLG